MIAARRHLAVVAGAVACALTLTACGADDGTVGRPTGPVPSAAKVRPQLKRLESQANRVIDGGTGPFKTQLASLRGAPVVVNNWASWCGPCRFEFPFFQKLAVKYRDRVAFVGVDSLDAKDAAGRFLKRFPVTYPSYFDPKGSMARSIGGGRGLPETFFFSRSGKPTFTHVGGYTTEATLDADIQRYALNG